MNWIGPITVDALLDRVAVDWDTAPPEANGVYLVSLHPWVREPTRECVPLYVGGNTGVSDRFRTRMGDMIADLFGFCGNSTGHHSGGISLNCYCADNHINPKHLYVGWAEKCDCGRCGEVELFDRLAPRARFNRSGTSRHQNWRLFSGKFGQPALDGDHETYRNITPEADHIVGVDCRKPVQHSSASPPQCRAHASCRMPR